MTLSHKIQLDPTVKQRIYFAKAAGTSRFVYNWALAEWNRLYEAGEKPTGYVLEKNFNAMKYKEFPWIKEIHRDAHKRPFTNLHLAFNRFFQKKAKRPTFKKKGKRDAFYMENYVFRVDGSRIRLPRIGWIRLTEPLRFAGKINYAVVSRKADRWFISVSVDVGEYKKPRVSDNIVGVDLGLTSFATLSTGEHIIAPKPLRTMLSRLQKRSRDHSRKQKGSNNKKKSAMRLARLHAEIGNVRSDFLHKLSTRLCQENQLIAIEDLRVRNMIKNRKLSRAIADASWSEFRRQLEYKATIFGTQVVVVNPRNTSKACSNCGCIKETLSLSDRVYRCTECGVEIDRDVNAAKNIHTLGSREIQACGESVRPVCKKAVLAEAGTRKLSVRRAS
ncbi:MAG: hypothetical protein A2Y38_07525 [Spirochaetes bacterium GWB1_59_5]|nr:MAG: hypothetical protein A2Y38_07525 [Spirochaetes bacterium GWB1_59_5]